MNTANQTLRALILLLACFAVACDDTSAEDDGGPTGMDAATPADAAVEDSGTSPLDGGPPDSGASDGGAPDGGPADSGPLDGGPPDSGMEGDGITCGDTVCTGGDICCVVLGPTGSAACMAPDDCEAAALTCDGPEDCGGAGACCLTATGSPPAVSISAVCAAPTDASCQSEFCHTDEDCSDPTMSCCPSPAGLGQVCSPACL